MDTLESVKQEAAKRRAKAKQQFTENYSRLKGEGFTSAESELMSRWSQKRIENVVREMRLKKGQSDKYN